MIENIKKFGIGLAFLAGLILVVLGFAQGGFIAWVLLFAIALAAAYMIGSAVLEVYRLNKQYKVTR
jgi:hypothetical protein